MKYGFVLPIGDPTAAAELAEVAEHSGWDGFFCWEGVWATDAWVSLAAAATGLMLLATGVFLIETPLPALMVMAGMSQLLFAKLRTVFILWASTAEHADGLAAIFGSAAPSRVPT